VWFSCTLTPVIVPRVLASQRSPDALFHRERPHLPHSARSVEIIEPSAGSRAGTRYESEAAGGVKEGAREPAQLQAG
jgi:hypothetical protein